MISREVQITNRLGLHARAAAKFVSLASTFQSRVDLEKDGKRVNGKSIMSVMMLAASRGSTLRLSVEGEDETQACEQLEALINDKFGEGE